MVTYDDDGNVNSTPMGFPVPQGQRFHLVLVTHDESTFYANDHHKSIDRHKSMWTHKSDKATPQSKGEGDIFKWRTNGFATGLFIFDNAPSHQKRAPDALSA